ncbi:hypothetical protein [Cupriavidus sp. 8B]
MHRRTFLAGGVIAPFALGGCMTRALYKEITTTETEAYTETVSQILISQDGKSIVILGATFHYVLDANPNLMQAISSSLHAKLVASFSEFRVDREGELKGRVTLSLDGAAAEDAQQQATALGFKRSGRGGSDDMLSRSYYMEGKRYRAGRFAMSDRAKQLNQTYTISVNVERAVGGKAALALLTPITVAADGAIFLLAIPLAPIAVGVMAAMKN